MSAPPLNEAAPIPDGARFYNPAEAISPVVEAMPETRESVSPPQNNLHSMGGSIPPGGFQIATDLDSVQASYIGEDGRFTLLREIYTMFRTMAAANSSGSSARIPQETLRLLPIISRTLIQFVGELQAKNSQLQAGERQTQARIDSLQREVKLLKEAKSKLESKNDGLKRDIREVERSYANIKAQKDSLKAELDQLSLRATSDSGVDGSSKKRRCLD